MYLPDSNDIVHIRMDGTDLTDGDAVKWIKGRDDSASPYRDYVKVDAATWDRSAAAKCSIDFKINTPGVYGITFLATTLNRECFIWIEFDRKQKVIDADGRGRIRFPFSNSSYFWGWQHTNNDNSAYMYAGTHNITLYSISNDLLIQDIKIRPVAEQSAGNIPIPYQRYSIDGNETDPGIISPRNGATLDGRTQQFRFVENDATVDAWRIHLGSAVGDLDIREIDNWPSDNITFSDLPIGGSDIYLRLWSLQSGTWVLNGDYKYKSLDPRIKEQNYSDWLQDSTRDKDRVLLVELDHADGTVTLASQPWLNNDDNVAYDDWIINNPYLESSIGTSIQLGDIEAVNPVLDENWLNYSFHGYRCRWYFGSVNWHKSQFRLIGSAIIEGVRETADRHYIFDLIGDSFKLKTPYPNFTAEIENTSVVENAIISLMSLWELSGEYQFINMPESVLTTKSLRYQIKSNSTVLDIINKIAASINAYTRVSQRGFLEMFKLDRTNQPSVTYTDDNIDMDGIRMIDTVHAVSQITIVYDKDKLYTLQIESETASLAEELRVETYLYTAADAEELARELEPEYVNNHHIYEIKVIGFADLTQEGDVIIIDHPRLAGSGMVLNIERTPLSNVSTVEVKML